LGIFVQKTRHQTKVSTAYLPQSDGQTERVNQVLGGYLRIFVNYDQDDWYHLLPLAEFAYNNSVTNAHNMTPFFANYGYHPQTEWLKECEARNPGANLYAHWMQTIHRQARQSLEKTREAMGRYYNRKAKQQPDFKIGDMVMLNAKNIRTKRPSKKLAPKLYGLSKSWNNGESLRINSNYRNVGKSTRYFMYRYSSPIEHLFDRPENNHLWNPKRSMVILNGRWKKSFRVK